MPLPADTVRQLITDALVTIGSLGQGEPLSPALGQYCLRMLRDMTDAWKAERLLIYVVPRVLYDIVAGQGGPTNPYTIGPGGDFDQQRPLWIQSAGIVSFPGQQNEFELPVDVIDDYQWARLGVKRTPTTLPTALYYDYAFTDELGNIFLWPVPSVSNIKLALYCPTPVEALDDLNTAVIYPPGYRRALHFNLAVTLCPGLSRPVDPKAEQIAIDSKALVERSNSRFQDTGVDPALISPQCGTFNWITGQSGRSGLS